MLVCTTWMTFIATLRPMRLSILNLSKSTRNTKKSAIKLNTHIPSHYLKTVLYSVKIKIFPSKIHTFFLIEKKGGSPCLFKRKRAFISMSSSAWGKSLTLRYQCTPNDNLALSLPHGHTFHKTPNKVYIFWQLNNCGFRLLLDIRQEIKPFPKIAIIFQK